MSRNWMPPPANAHVLTAVRASSARSPFFHARLQEGQRIDEPEDEEELEEEDSEEEVEALLHLHARVPGGEATPALCVMLPRRTAAVSIADASPALSLGGGRDQKQHAARGHPTEKSPHHARASSSPPSLSTYASSAGPSTPAAMSDTQDFWAMVQDTPIPAPATRRYHYLTRSQSTGNFAPAAKPPDSPSSVYPVQPSPLRTEFDPREPDSVQHVSPSHPWSPSQRHLSPIDEGSYFTERQQGGPQADTISLNSTMSVQSNLFINRPVRRTPSTSTFNSTNSAPPRMQPSDPHYHPAGPPRTYARSFSTLPVIPASPRESQNVYETEPPESVLKFPMPVVYPPPIEYSPFEPPQDAADEMPEHRRTSSIISRTDSVRTELTYLTADNTNSLQSRRRTMDGTSVRRRSALHQDNTDYMRGSKLNVASRFKASIETLISKSSQLSSVAAAKWTLLVLHFRQPTSMIPRDQERRPMWDINGKPSEVLFWTGFIAPWCWLVGGWMLARNGQTMLEGRSSSEKGPVLPLTSREADLRASQRRAGAPGSLWSKTKVSSAEVWASLRGGGARDGAGGWPRRLRLRGDSTTTAQRALMDPWVSRCRVAAVVSGMIILALCIVALVVLIRAL